MYIFICINEHRSARMRVHLNFIILSHARYILNYTNKIIAATNILGYIYMKIDISQKIYFILTNSQ